MALLFVGGSGGDLSLRYEKGKRARIRVTCSRGGGSIASPDVVIVGGGGVGLSTALSIARKGAQVVVVGRQKDGTATRAAAGMLAPQAERLEDGPLLSLCLKSRNMYPEFVESVSQRSDVDIPFDNSGKFMGPLLSPQEDLLRPPPKRAGVAEWLDLTGLRMYEPSIGDDVIGGWLYGGDCRVDNTALYSGLSTACVRAGVEIVDANVMGISSRPGGSTIEGVRLEDGNLIRGGHFVIAAGSWTRHLLSLPVRPVKGQMLKLRPTAGTPPDANALGSVLFGQNVYVVPRYDGSIIVGSTVEDVGFSVGVTAGGISYLLAEAMKLVPSLATYELEQTWFGYRPSTPDLMPILGRTRFENCTVATGHHRNGILLLPVTAHLTANIALGQPQDDPELEELVQEFSYNRFRTDANTPKSTLAKQVMQKDTSASHQEVGSSRTVNGFGHPKDTDKHESVDVGSVSQKKNMLMGDASVIRGFDEAAEEEKWKDEILVWKVEEDGSETPISYKQSVEAFEKGYGHTQLEEELRKEEIQKLRFSPGTTQTETPSFQPLMNIKAQQVKDQVQGLREKSEERRPVTPSSTTDTGTDAYDDILIGRDAADADQQLSSTLLKNRTFGVDSTRVGVHGQKLCISDTEFDRFDAAAKSIEEDARKFREAWKRRDEIDDSGENLTSSDEYF